MLCCGGAQWVLKLRHQCKSLSKSGASHGVVMATVSLWLLTRTVKEELSNPKFDLGDLCRELGSSATSTVDCSNAELAKAVTGAAFLVCFFCGSGFYLSWEGTVSRLISSFWNYSDPNHDISWSSQCQWSFSLLLQSIQYRIMMHHLFEAPNRLFTVRVTNNFPFTPLFSTWDATQSNAMHHDAGGRMLNTFIWSCYHFLDGFQCAFIY